MSLSRCRARASVHKWHNGRDWLENSAQSNSGQHLAKAAIDEAIIYDGSLIRKADKSAPKASAESSRIADFGEKISGAKKDLWAGYKDKLARTSLPVPKC